MKYPMFVAKTKQNKNKWFVVYLNDRDFNWPIGGGLVGKATHDNFHK
jgi:hypothetical protein